MKEDLEKYLKENRTRLDVEEPDHDIIWEGISSGLRKEKQAFPKSFWKVAAVFIFAVSVTWFVATETTKNKVVVITLSDISEDLGKKEAELKQEVNLKWTKVEPQISTNNYQIRFLLEELKELDTIYQSYQADLGKTDDNERIIDALLDYYEKKIQILNRISLEIEKQNDHEKSISL